MAKKTVAFTDLIAALVHAAESDSFNVVGFNGGIYIPKKEVALFAATFNIPEEVLYEHGAECRPCFGTGKKVGSLHLKFGVEELEVQAQREDEAARTELRLQLTQRQLKAEKTKQHKALIEEEDLVRRHEELLTELETYFKQSRPAPVINYTPSPMLSENGKCVPMLFLSDLHIDGTVDPREVHGLNRYNKQIAKERFDKLFDNFSLVTLRENNVSNKLCVIAIGGDLFEGYIHDELRENKSMPIAEAVESFVDWIEPHIIALAQQFKEIYMPFVVGNHGRMDRKPRCIGKSVDNFEYMAIRTLKRILKHSAPNVNVDIASGTDAIFEVNGHVFLMTHGDQCRPAGGVGGVWPALLKMQARKREKLMALGIIFNTMLVGHFHQFHWAHNIIMNGSLKGYDAYANQCNFGYEPPRQAGFLVHPLFGVETVTPLYCQKNPFKIDDTAAHLNGGLLYRPLSVSEPDAADLFLDADGVPEIFEA